MAENDEYQAQLDRLAGALLEKESEDPRKADRLIDYFVTHENPAAQRIGRRMRRFLDSRREFLAHGTYHGLPVYDPDKWDGPVHTVMEYFPDGTAEGIVTLPLYLMEHYRQYCKYCYTTHHQWWMMDQRDYLVNDMTILLCGKCEYTSPQDHETPQHRFQPPTEAMMDESIASFRNGNGSGTRLVRAIPRHATRQPHEVKGAL